MRYRIEYTKSKYCTFANSRKELIQKLRDAAEGTISDIRKQYNSGVSDSVLETYMKYIGRR